MDSKLLAVEVEFGPAELNWHPLKEHNVLFIRNVENFANAKLAGQGHVFLNEVLDALGLRRLPVGQTHGWLSGEGGVSLVISETLQDGTMLIRMDPYEMWENI